MELFGLLNLAALKIRLLKKQVVEIVLFFIGMKALHQAIILGLLGQIAQLKFLITHFP